MAFVAPLLPLLPTILGAGSAALAGVNAIEQGNYQSQVAKNNAAIAERNAAMESERSQHEQMRSDHEYAAQVGEMLAASGASGLDVLGRSQLAARNVTRRTGREAAGDIRAQGTASARNLMQDAANFRTEGRNAKRQGLVSGIGAFASGAAGVANDMGWTKSLATSRTRAGRRPDWYGRG